MARPTAKAPVTNRESAPKPETVDHRTSDTRALDHAKPHNYTVSTEDSRPALAKDAAHEPAQRKGFYDPLTADPPGHLIDDDPKNRVADGSYFAGVDVEGTVRPDQHQISHPHSDIAFDPQIASKDIDADISTGAHQEPRKGSDTAPTQHLDENIATDTDTTAGGADTDQDDPRPSSERHLVASREAGISVRLLGVVLQPDSTHHVVYHTPDNVREGEERVWPVESSAQPNMDESEAAPLWKGEKAASGYLVIPTGRLSKDNWGNHEFDPDVPEAPYFVASLDALK